MPITDFIKSVNQDLPTILIIRHAQRNYYEGKFDYAKDAACGLTEQGRLDAVELGKNLKLMLGDITKVISSPIGRCIDTGTQILIGNRGSIDVNTLRILETAYIYNPELAITNFQSGTDQLSIPEVHGKVFAEQRLPGIRHINYGTNLLLEPILRDLMAESGVTLYVTHDSVLHLLFGALSNVPVLENNWFTYLDGICLQYDKEGEILLYRGSKVFYIKEKILELKPMFPELNAITLNPKLYCFDFDHVIVNGDSAAFFIMQNIKVDAVVSKDPMLEYIEELQHYIKLKHPKELFHCMKEIFKNGDKIAITSFNGFGGIILPYLKAAGLTKQEIESIHIEYARWPLSRDDHEARGKNLHIQGAMEYFGIDSKSAVTLIDYCPINIGVAQRSGYSTVLVPKGMSNRSYFDALPSSSAGLISMPLTA